MHENGTRKRDVMHDIVTIAGRAVAYRDRSGRLIVLDDVIREVLGGRPWMK